MERTWTDDESVVGEECHLVSSQPGGPRYTPDCPVPDVDAYENLILLCRVHHKQIDDQPETYTVTLLQQMKSNHEQWVQERLEEERKPPQFKLRFVRKNIPTHLARLCSGRDVVAVMNGACAGSFENDELRSEEEVDLIGGSFQEIQDWIDLLLDLEPMDRVRIPFNLNEKLKELESPGFWVFGGQEIQRLEGGPDAPARWPVAILRVLRITNPDIIRVDVGAEGKPPGETS